MTYGYEMINGNVVINQREAGIVRQIFRNYISGMSFTMSARKAGITLSHSSVKRILLKKCYVGDDFYPAIIDRETFLTAYDRIKSNTCSRSARRKEPVIYTEFEMDEPTKSFDDPFEQAEYIYSLIGVK
ncbi:MAG TPA: hypothetical protein RWN64_04490 [Ruminococcus sp.]